MSLYRYSGNTAGHWKLQFTYNYFRSKPIVWLIWANWASALLLVAEGYVYLRQKVGDWIQAFMSLKSEVDTGQRDSVGQGSTRFIQDQVQPESWVIWVGGREMEEGSGNAGKKQRDLLCSLPFQLRPRNIPGTINEAHRTPGAEWKLCWSAWVPREECHRANHWTEIAI